MSALRLGAPIVDAPEDPRELAAAHVARGYTAAYCPDVDPGDGARVRALREAFAAADVVFAEAGAWCNLLHPDPPTRARNHAYARTRLALADELGARCAVDYLGSFDAASSYGPHPRNLDDDAFAAGVEIVRGIVDAVKPRRAVFALEMMQWVLPDSVACYARFVRAVDRPTFGVHVDPVNLVMTPRRYYGTRSLLREIFRELGPWIASCHAKDLRLRGELALHFDEVAPGRGGLDYDAYLAELRGLGREVPLMLEHLPSDDDYRAAAAFIRSRETAAR